MHFSDLEPCAYSSGPCHYSSWRSPLLAIGWIDCGNYTQGALPKDVLERINVFRQETINRFRRSFFLGLHQCSLCGYSAPGPGLPNSNYNIFVPGNQRIYVAPGRVDHYCEVHGYLPPEEFLMALMRSPTPASVDYLPALQRSNCGYIPPCTEDYIPASTKNDLLGELFDSPNSVIVTFGAMRPTTFRLWCWKRQINRVRTGMTQAEVRQRLGEPSRKLGSSEVNIWSYDLRRLGDTLYSIRVAFNEERVYQAYLGIEVRE